MYRPSLPSLHTGWCSRDKQVPVPDVAYVSDIHVAGLYISPSIDYIIYDSIHILPSKNGTIIINSDHDNIAAVIAHEYRHHWQYHHGWSYDGIQWQFDADYISELTNYYRESHSEMDALNYELIYAPCEESRWIRALIKENRRYTCKGSSGNKIKTMNIGKDKEHRLSDRYTITNTPRSELLPEIYSKYSNIYRDEYDSIFRKDSNKKKKKK
jgi:hypothetical protein